MSEQLPHARGTGPGLAKSDIFQVLQNERRRYVLRYLRGNGAPVNLGDLATQVAAWEYERPSSEISTAQRKRVYTTLQQTHLPRMNEVGIVDYDADTGTIDRTEHTDELTVYLEIVPRREFPWREYYLSLGAISLAIVATLWSGFEPFTWIPPLVWATVIATLFTLSAVYHTFVARSLTLSEYGARLESRDD